jgi:alkanesulfonate monooxygenase SsuD/methylene tetrahydromethanopterin reductase-like flavin-dependent oxidoreductase (luciferase family)
MGFVRGVPQEVPIANLNPVFQSDRFWEAHDFIMKALTSHDEPFNWESENFHYRQVNIWPRCYQQPHPPVWSTTGSTYTAKKLGGYGYVMADAGNGYATRRLFDAYRQGYAEKRGGAEAGADPVRVFGAGGGGEDGSGGAEAGRADRVLSAVFLDRVCAVPQSAGLSFDRG